MSNQLGEHPAGNEGFAEHLRSLAASLATYLKARLQLAGLESKEASAHYFKILALLLAGFVGFIFGYIFFIIASVFLISTFTGISWMWILFGVGILHFLAAGAAVWTAKGKFAQPMFSATITEFKKDQSWLTTKPH